MPNIRMRLLIFFIALVSFVGPFAAVIAVENAKRAEKLISDRQELLKDQPDLIKQGQKTVTQTTVEPVTTQKVVNVPVTTSKPKSSTSTTQSKR